MSRYDGIIQEAHECLRDGKMVDNYVARQLVTCIEVLESRLIQLRSDKLTLQDDLARWEKLAKERGEGEVQARAESAELRELHNMQLAAVSTATIQNTETTIKDRIGPDNPYYTTAYGDTCRAVDREMRLIAENAALRADKERLDWLDDVNQAINTANGTEYGWRYDVNHNRAQVALTDCNIPALSIRAAIDAARNATA